MTKRSVWVAGPDGIGHLERGRAARTACELPSRGEREGWPVKRRCINCLAQQATSALPEELLMAGYGVRMG